MSSSPKCSMCARSLSPLQAVIDTKAGIRRDVLISRSNTAISQEKCAIRDNGQPSIVEKKLPGYYVISHPSYPRPTHLKSLKPFGSSQIPLNFQFFESLPSFPTLPILEISQIHAKIFDFLPSHSRVSCGKVIVCSCSSFVDLIFHLS